MREICVNKLITYFATGAQYLVLWISPDNAYGYWYDLNSSSHKPVKFEPGKLLAAETDYEISDYQPPDNRSESCLSETEKNHRDRLWDMMKIALEYEPEIYERNTRAEILHTTAEEHNIKLSNLYPLLDRYWRSGKSKNAFVPAFHRRGGKGSVRNPVELKIGRKTQSGISEGKAVTETDRANFASAVKKYYLTRNKLTLTAVYEKLLSEFYSIKDDTGQKKLLPPNERPTIYQFRYWHSRQRNIEAEQRKRNGDSTFELNGRAVLGKSDYGLMGPGAQFQVDATIGDVYLLSRFDRSSIIGRPVLYFIMDAFSRMVVGMSVGLEGPSWNALAAAIINMAADKVAFCKQYGIEIKEEEWPCRHIPSVLRGDRGELISKNADNLANVLGIRVENAPPYRADLKGIIEQNFRTINVNGIKQLPGSVKSDFSRRGGHDYRHDATLDIRQLTWIIIKCVLYYNNHQYMESFEKSEAMTAAGVEATPIKLWEWGIENCSGALRVFPEKTVKFAVLPTENATVTEKGVRFKGLYYCCDLAKAERWFEKARATKYWSIAVSYDPHDMTNIYIWNNDLNRYDDCYLLDWNSKNAGKTLAEIMYEQQKEKAEGKRLKIAATEAKVNLNADIDSIVAEARQMNKSAPAKSKSERVSKIRENRSEEIAAIRREENVAANSEGEAESKTLVPPKKHPDEELSPRLRMIKAKAEEKLKND